MDSHDKTTRAQKTDRIRELNDRLRTTGVGGRTMLTKAVAELLPDELDRLLTAVREFDGFSERNDPHGEHDFGQVTLGGQPYFWKLDYYDVNCEFGSLDPADETITSRVLTLMTSGDL